MVQGFWKLLKTVFIGFNSIEFGGAGPACIGALLWETLTVYAIMCLLCVPVVVLCVRVYGCPDSARRGTANTDLDRIYWFYFCFMNVCKRVVPTRYYTHKTDAQRCLTSPVERTPPPSPPLSPPQSPPPSPLPSPPHSPTPELPPPPYGAVEVRAASEINMGLGLHAVTPFAAGAEVASFIEGQWMPLSNWQAYCDQFELPSDWAGFRAPKCLPPPTKRIKDVMLYDATWTSPATRPSWSYLNHDPNPNCCASMPARNNINDCTVRFIALRNIAAGEELVIMYGGYTDDFYGS